MLHKNILEKYNITDNDYLLFAKYFNLSPYDRSTKQLFSAKLAEKELQRADNKLWIIIDSSEIVCVNDSNINTNF